MCLLVNQPATTSFTDDFLADVYSKNKDGFGIMYAEGGEIHIYKTLPANAQDFIDFYRKHADGRDCVWHARMQTHGDVDLDNCHPYQVTDDIWMAHNGVLSAGNDNDMTRSDTWHFIRNVIAPALKGDPDLLLDADWQSFIGDVIGGSNKFGFVRADGEVVIINKKSGVEFVGAWLSNTYAWSTTKFGFQTPSYQGSGYGTKGYSSGREWWSGYGSYYNGNVYASAYDDDYRPTTSGSLVTTKAQAQEEAEDGYVLPECSEAMLRKIVRAASNSWTRNGLAGIEQWVKDAPHKAAHLLALYYQDTDDMFALAHDDPEEAAVWIDDLFRTDAISPSLLA